MIITGTAVPPHQGYLVTIDPAVARGSDAGNLTVANRAHFVRVRATHNFTATKMGFALATTSGNFDLGVYSKSGTTVTRLASTGSTACGTGSSWQEGTLTVSLAIHAGTDYFLALCLDNTTATVIRSPGATYTFGSTVFDLAYFKDTAFPLGSSHATVSASGLLPLIALY